MDEWRYPIIVRTPTPYANLAALESARYALRGYPRQALRIDRVVDQS